MLAVYPAGEGPPARSSDDAEGSSSGSGSGGGDGEDYSSGNGAGSLSPLAGRAADAATAATAASAAAAELAPSPRLAMVDRQESAGSALSSSWRSPYSLRSWGGGDATVGRGSVVEEGEEGSGLGNSAEHGPSYHCQVCLDDRPAEAGFTLAACGHTFCRACLTAYVTSKVNDAQVYPTCFHVTEELHTVGGGDDERVRRKDDDDDEEEDDHDDEDDDDDAVAAENGRARVTRGSELGGGEPGRGRRAEKPESCGVVLSPSDIEELLSADAATSRKYARFLFSRENETARECPKCLKLSIGDPSVSLEMRCDGCGAVFCYEHGGAHEGRSCAEYVESTADETHRTMAVIGRLTKPCPGCGTPVEKLGGCNQMVCLHCNCSFCWICMEQVDRGTFPAHFQWWNVRGCPNQQLQEDSDERSTRGRRCLQALSILQILVVGPIALLLTVASSVACFCCLPAFDLPPRQLFSGCISGWGNFVMVLPLIPVACAGAVLAGIVYIIMLPFRLFKAMRRKCRYGRSGLSWSFPGSRSSGISRARSGDSDSSSSSSTSSLCGSITFSWGASISSSGRLVPAGASGGASALENGAIGAADVDVETVEVPPPAASVAAAAAAATAAAAALVEVLGSGSDRQLAIPLGVRRMISLGASSSSSLAAAAAAAAGSGAAVSGAAGAASKGEDEDDIGQASGGPTTGGEGAASNTSAVFAPYSSPGNEEPPHPPATSTDGSIRDGRDDLV